MRCDEVLKVRGGREGGVGGEIVKDAASVCVCFGRDDRVRGRGSGKFVHHRLRTQAPQPQ